MLPLPSFTGKYSPFCLKYWHVSFSAQIFQTCDRWVVFTNSLSALTLFHRVFQGVWGLQICVVLPSLYSQVCSSSSRESRWNAPITVARFPSSREASHRNSPALWLHVWSGVLKFASRLTLVSLTWSIPSNARVRDSESRRNMKTASVNQLVSTINRAWRLSACEDNPALTGLSYWKIWQCPIPRLNVTSIWCWGKGWRTATTASWRGMPSSKPGHTTLLVT